MCGIAAALTGLLLGRFCAAETIRVPEDYATIQSALSSSSGGDSVCVAPGVFAGPGNRDLNFEGKSIALVGAGAGVTILDCEGEAGSPHRGIDFSSGEGPGTVVEALTIRNGHSATWSGGINCRGSSPTLRRLVVEDCFATTFGGGIGVWAGGSPLIEDCTLRFNQAGTEGGGVSSPEGAPTLRRCEIVSNTSGGGGGAFLRGGPALVEDCLFADNTCMGGGGGIKVRDCVVVVRRSTLRANIATGSVGGGFAVAVSGNVEFQDVVVVGNSADIDGGGVWITAATSGILRQCTISGNHAAGVGGGAAIYSSGVTLETTILRNNCTEDAGDDLYLGESIDGPAVVPAICCAFDPATVQGPGRLDVLNGVYVAEDPGFCIATPCTEAPSSEGIYSLRDDSPCLPANNPCGMLIGAQESGCSAADADHVADPVVRLSLFPSPISRTGTLRLWLQPGDQAVDLYDASGRHLATMLDRPGYRAGGLVSLRLSSVLPAAGIYLIRVRGGGGFRAGSVVVLE
ncbi:MAG: right-handed parallel beta-helix repeat-containing protein [Candidatus Eisenbacteria bacterium]|nr:right-handed parallel beta-helix repeat-containing protein [Candidatus Eisenbacteria bacterium]MCC7141327.1 right-handed parallel beta-helix repeat-containing protein [Candidatus Eisenbacteria bacterium]